MSSSNGAISSPLGENVRRLLRQVLGQGDASDAVPATGTAPLLRRSNGLREFWSGIERAPGGGILDLGSASQSNLSFITSRGHKLYAEDLFRFALRPAAPQNGKPNGSPQFSEEERFFRENLSYAEGQFNGILCWDLLDFLPDSLVEPFVENMHYFLKPGGSLLAFFHTGQPGTDVAAGQYRINALDSLELTGNTTAKLRRNFNNRAIENLFRKFASLKFYLSRDSLREVIIVR